MFHVHMMIRSWLTTASIAASYDTYFVDLFVRVSNSVAIGMYEKFGYSVYRRVLEYYSGYKGEDSEDAFGR
jgi:ribosomal protein S18 acetylase RimI-like enzyme